MLQFLRVTPIRLPHTTRMQHGESFWGQTLEPLSENCERLFPLGKTSLSLSLSLSLQ